MRKTKEQQTKDQKLKTSHGITLIALIITIIVMIILVAVTVTMAVNGGLFSKAQIAGTQTNETVKKEQELGNGRIKIGDTWYDSPQDYVNNKLSANQGNGESEDETTESNCKMCNNTGFEGTPRCVRCYEETSVICIEKYIYDSLQCSSCGYVNEDAARSCYEGV